MIWNGFVTLGGDSCKSSGNPPPAVPRCITGFSFLLSKPGGGVSVLGSCLRSSLQAPGSFNPDSSGLQPEVILSQVCVLAVGVSRTGRLLDEADPRLLSRRTRQPGSILNIQCLSFRAGPHGAAGVLLLK